MPSFPRPRFQYTPDVDAEIGRLRQHRQARRVPAKAQDRLLIATWNIANFGEQRREEPHHRLIAEVLSWFDLVAVQEIKENFGPLEEVVRTVGAQSKCVMSDIAGNGERAAFVYDSQKVTLLEKIGEIALPPKDLKNIKLPGVKQKFAGFDRTPYLAMFQAGQSRFLLVNVHLFFGSDAKKADIGRRALETFAVARWAQQREKSKFSFTRDIIALGDFNMPKVARSDPIYRALTSKGLHLPQHTSQMGSNLKSDKHYDQIAFFPGATQADFTGNHGVFDFDAVVFPDLWQNRGQVDFNKYVKYYLSDHRPMWIEFMAA
jgi:endonuclease/exonuclease/phosphatase family metal-dependent hydrolase